MVFPIYFAPIFLQKMTTAATSSDGATAALWIVGIVVGAAIATFTGVLITQNLNRFYKMSEDRYARLEKSDEKQLEKLDKVMNAISEIHFFVNDQKGKNKFYAEEIQENRKTSHENQQRIMDALIELLKKK